jgi:hypothetical protein
MRNNVYKIQLYTIRYMNPMLIINYALVMLLSSSRKKNREYENLGLYILPLENLSILPTSGSCLVLHIQNEVLFIFQSLFN